MQLEKDIVISNNISDKTTNQIVWYFRGITRSNGFQILLKPSKVINIKSLARI